MRDPSDLPDGSPAGGAAPRRGSKLKAVATILTGNAGNAALLLIRNLVIARLISVENYGIAATFSVAIAVIEMASTFGLQQLLIQDRRGDDPRFQAALQGFQLIRGLMNGAVLFLLAGPFATFMGVPEVTWAHQLLALILVCNGLVHFDSYRVNRQMRYGPAMVVAMTSPLGALAVIWPLWLIWGDYRVMLWSMIVQAASNMIATHLVAERPYRLVFDRAVIRESLRFGWPLLTEGLLLFAIFNGEKVIVGREFGMEPLALLTMAITLTLTPALILQKTAATFFLPQLSGAADPARFRHLALATLESHLLAAGVIVLAVALCGPPFVHLALGPKYAAVGDILVLLAVMQALRLLKGGGSTVSIARSRTANGMLANILRVATLPLAWIAALQGAGLVTIIAIGVAGEAAGVVASFWLLRRQLGLPLAPLALPGLCLIVLVAAGLAGAAAQAAGAWPPGPMAALWPLGLLVPLGALLAAAPDLRRYLRQRALHHEG